MLFVERAGSRWFRVVPAKDPELGGRQQPPPLGLGPSDLECLLGGFRSSSTAGRTECRDDRRQKRTSVHGGLRGSVSLAGAFAVRPAMGAPQLQRVPGAPVEPDPGSGVSYDHCMPAAPLASIVIPAWRDREALEAGLGSLVPHSQAEVIVALALGDANEHRDLAKKLDWIRWVEGPRGRASQMNAGARASAGRWLVFLHADSRLPANWLDVIASADSRETVVGGAFRFVLDTADWRARVIELGVRLRVRLLKLPYGDQAIFVRRSVFDRLGGYADLPLMEDVDLVRRLRGAGTLMFSPAPVTTSPRRWERDGWVRRSAHNLTLATRYLLGASPARLACHYFGRKPTAIVVMARAPWTGGKTRLGDPDHPGHKALREALFLDTLDAARSLSDADCIVACEPAIEVPAMRRAIDPGVDVLSQRGDTLGQRLAHLFEDTFRLGYESVLIVGSDLPDLPLASLTAARAAVASGVDRVVLGPATDGGYYLVGLNRMHEELFAGVDWGTDRVMEQTTAIAARIGLPVGRLDQWGDVDHLGDLARLSVSSDGHGARRTRQWMKTYGAGWSGNWSG